MIVAVCGGRDYRLTADDRAALLGIHAQHGISQLLHGDCRGADRDAETWARTLDIPTQAYEAAWELYGKAAGPIRGKNMVDDCDMLIVFPGGKGTQHAVSYAKKQGKVIRFMAGNAPVRPEVR